MHPAKSVILFTTASGAGYGMMMLVGAVAPFNHLPADRGFAVALFALMFALIVGGLLSSTLHLGHPERAWRAVSQWRSSWLSREGVAALVTFIPLGLFAFIWVVFGEARGVAGWIALAGGLLSLVTVYCTAMIYASLRAIPAWRTGWTIAGYMVLAVMTGAILLNGLMSAFYPGTVTPMAVTALVATALGLAVKLGYWHHLGNRTGPDTSGTATGLQALGQVKLLEAPHTTDNYLMKEMGFEIARKHSRRLRQISVVVGFALPALLLVLALITNGAASSACSILAVPPAAIGILIERWLFFAEAKHVVTLYYGQERI